MDNDNDFDILTLTDKNHWLALRVQTGITLFVSYICFRLIQWFRSYAELPISLQERIVYCIIPVLVLSVMAYVLKLVVSYDTFLWEPVKKGSLNPDANEAYLIAMKAFIPSLFITYFGFKGHLFAYQLIGNVIIFILLVWLQYGLIISNKWSASKERKFRRLLSGKCCPPPEDIKLWAKEGFQINTKRMIGFGSYGTVFGGQQNDDKNLVIKCIDLSEWYKNRYSSKLDAEKLRTIAKKSNATLNLLSGIRHNNITEFRKEKGSSYRRQYLITQKADMNLDHFLTKVKPKGVSEVWAHDWFKQISKGIEALHLSLFPIAHSNLKPENILLYRRPQHWNTATGKALPGIAFKDLYVLKLTDFGFESFMSLYGRVNTKRNPIVMIGPPIKAVGRRHLTKYMTRPGEPEDRPFDDIYQLAVILILLMNGDIHQLIKRPGVIDVEGLKESGLESVCIRFDKIDIIRKLPNKMSKELENLLKKMMAYVAKNRLDIRQVMQHKWFIDGPQV